MLGRAVRRTEDFGDRKCHCVMGLYGLEAERKEHLGIRRL